MHAFVYFARFANHSIKIGISRNLTDRLRTLERETGVRGSFIGRLDVTDREAPIIERALHRALGPFWIRGEWFSDCPEVRAEIRRLLRDPMAVQAIVDRVRGAEWTARQLKDQPRPNVRVIARLAGDIMRERGPECPAMVIEEALGKACEAYRIPADDIAIARAMRIACARILQRGRGLPAAAATDVGEADTPLRRLELIVREAVREGTSETYADLIENVKWYCARLRLPYDGTAIGEAVNRLEHRLGRPLVTS